MVVMKPRPSIYIPEFIAANQESRADNILSGTMAEQVTLKLPLPVFSGNLTNEPELTRDDVFRWSASERTSVTSGRSVEWIK